MSDPRQTPPDVARPRTSGANYDAVRAAIDDRYLIEREIGEGGMATVFLAEDRKHRRKVAVKVLQESLTHTIGIRRFLQEIEVIARLQHPHLLTLIDSGRVPAGSPHSGEQADNGLPYYVMPFVEGQSLRELIAREGRLPVDRAVAIAREVADGLAYAHRHGVVHRDVKPSNILLSGGHAVVADFGIATALQNSAVGRLTETGISMGSPVYMSPEQAAGERDLDERTDVYSLACVLFEMLTGQPPIDGESMQRMITRKLTGDHAPLRGRRSDVPPALDAAVRKALAPERADRFPSMQAFADALAAAVQGRARASRLALGAAAAAVLAAAAGGGLWVRHERRVVEATRQVGEISRLTLSGNFSAAFELAESVTPILPRDSTLRSLRPLFTAYFSLATDPPGARVWRRRVAGADTSWTLVGTTPLDSVAMPRRRVDASYMLRIEKDGYKTAHLLPDAFLPDVSGRSPLGPGDTLRLDRADEQPGMVRIPGFRVAAAGGRESIALRDYHIGRNEVTNREYMAFVNAGGYRTREYWTEPFVRDGRAVPWEQAMAELRDRSGLPGPSTWSGGQFPAGSEDYPVGGVSYYEAAAYARFAGKHLPTSPHWAQAALSSARGASWIYAATSNLGASDARPVGQGAINVFGLHDVAGNVREWCVNPIDSGRLTRGAGWEDAQFWVGHLVPKSDWDRSPSNGFRLAAYSDADSTIARLSGRITREVPRDFARVRPVPEAEFNIYRRLFDYDRTPLAPRLEAQGVRRLDRWEKVSFAAAYGGERMAAYIFLPKSATPPYEAVIHWPPSGVLSARSFDPSRNQLEAQMLGFIVQSGRALVLPVFKGAFERDDSAFSIVWRRPEKTTASRDLTIAWVKDVRRTIDYLETRSDIRSDRGVALLANSWGGRMAPVALAVEPRVKAAVLNVGGYEPLGEDLPEVELANYVPRVRTPTLMLNGRWDIVFPYETSQLPFFQQLGTPARDKKHVVYPTSHAVPQEALVRETLAWLDRYLSGR